MLAHLKPWCANQPGGPFSPLVPCWPIYARHALEAREAEVTWVPLLTLGPRGSTPPLDDVPARVTKVTLQSFQALRIVYMRIESKKQENLPIFVYFKIAIN